MSSWDASVTAVENILSYLGENVSRPGLRETPERFTKALGEWFSGYGQDPATVLKCFEDGAEGYEGILFQGSIPVYSFCEHHIAPFFGFAHFAYIPAGRIVGLSKIPRLIDIFSRRLQVQERLTAQIVDAFSEHVRPMGCGLVLQMRHFCMESRGIRLPGTVTTTSDLRGIFFGRPHVKEEFMRLVQFEQRKP